MSCPPSISFAAAVVDIPQFLVFVTEFLKTETLQTQRRAPRCETASRNTAAPILNSNNLPSRLSSRHRVFAVLSNWATHNPALSAPVSIGT
jgi:hypothetical protein